MPAPLHQRQYGRLMRRAAPNGNALLSTDKGFIDFYLLAFAARRSAKASSTHGFPNAVRHKPSDLERHAEDTMDLVGAEPLLADAHQIGGLQPLMHLYMAGIEDGAHLHGEGLRHW